MYIYTYIYIYIYIKVPEHIDEVTVDTIKVLTYNAVSAFLN